jgi:hypothetical protein
MDDGNECTSDVCDGDQTCTHPHNTAPCSDGDLCNGADTCSGGVCMVHAGNPCGSQAACRRTCVQTGSLQYMCNPDPAGTPCASDGITCTADVCNGGGLCTHPTAANGTSCEDGDRCTNGDTCQSGVCRSGTPSSCDPCLACEPQTGNCILPTSPGCAPSAPGRSSIALRHVPSGADKVVWRWRGGAEMEKTALGFPVSANGFKLCVFDQGGLVLSSTLPPGGTCAGKSCWRELPAGYRYADPELTPDGIQKMQSHAGPASQAKVTVKGRGPRLGLSSLGLVPPVTVRLERSDRGGCWESVHSVPIVSDVLQFKGKSD